MEEYLQPEVIIQHVGYKNECSMDTFLSSLKPNLKLYICKPGYFATQEEAAARVAMQLEL